MGVSIGGPQTVSKSQSTVMKREQLTALNILLICKHQKQRLLHLTVIDNTEQLLSCLLNTLRVIRVDDEDQALRAAVIVAPQWPDLVLPADIPHVEFHVLVGYGFDVEADSWDGGNVLVEFEFVEDGWWRVLAWFVE